MSSWVKPIFADNHVRLPKLRASRKETAHCEEYLNIFYTPKWVENALDRAFCSSSLSLRPELLEETYAEMRAAYKLFHLPVFTGPLAS